MQRLRGIVTAACIAGLAGVSACSQEGPVDPETTAVRATVEDFFRAMQVGDTERMQALVLDEGMGFALRPGEAGGGDGPPSGRPLAAMVREIGESEGEIVERIWDAKVRIAELPGRESAAMATLWAPYDFWLDGAFHHCGVDAFQLIRTRGDWRIANVVYTAHSENCPESPLGPVGE